MQSPWSRTYPFWAAYPSSFITLHLSHAHILAHRDWLISNFSYSLMSSYTFRITSWNILLHFAHLAGSHSSLMTQSKHLLSGHPSPTSSLQANGRSHCCSPMNLLHTFNVSLSPALTSLTATNWPVLLVFSPMDMFQEQAKEQMYKWH